MNSIQKNGYFVISLDFELYWGMFDKVSLDEYGERILGERTAIPRMLELFKNQDIHATWAVVGMLMARNKQELLSLLPPSHLRPIYEDTRISSYHHIETAHIGDDEKTDPYHFGPSLIKTILETPHQELGNHTFSHYYCIDGHANDVAIFARDLEAHNAISKTCAITTESIIFPRNQTSPSALRVCNEKEIRAYRGNENHTLYRPRKDTEQTLLIRGLRLLDHYFNISGHHTYSLPEKRVGEPLNIPASRFLRPWNTSLHLFEWLKLRRIKNSMTYAAKRGEIFHLWWHPHNFGIDQKENFKNLEIILNHFVHLQKKYGMQSMSMGEITGVALQTTA